MRDWIDKSPKLADTIEFLSNTLAQRRGLVPVIGIGLLIIGIILQILNVYLNHVVLELLGILLQGIGVLAALVGLLLAEPLGK